MLKKALFLLFIIPFVSFAGKLDRIKRAIESSDYEKAYELIQKVAEKEPFNPGVSYFQALLYQTATFKQYHLDSARIAINKSIDDFEKADEKTIEELKEDGIDLESAVILQTKIRDKQFQVLLLDLSISNVTSYRSKYPTSVYDEVLEFKRDSIIFLDVKASPTKQKVNEFMSDFPTSIFVPEAKEILDELNYFELKKNGKLANYYQFLAQYPTTNFRREVEEYILQYSTLDHSPESYLAFIKTSQTKVLQKKAADLLYYIKNQEEQTIARHPLRDSLMKISATKTLRLFPVMDRERFGFLSQEGILQIEYQFDEVQNDDKCLAVEDDWILVKNGASGLIIDKLGRVILQNVDEYQDLSHGVSLISQNGKTHLYHKSGFQILKAPVENAEILQGRWIKVTQNGKSELVSFLGIPITETQYDDIYLERSFWVFEKRGLLAVYTEELITDELHKKGLSLEFKFDDIETVGDNMFIGFRENKECLLNKELNFLIPWGDYTIYPDESGWYLKSDRGYQLYNSAEEDVMDRYFPYLESNKGWLALKTQDDWMLLPRKKGILPSRGYDSLKVINDFIVYSEKENQATIIFNDGSLLDLKKNDQIKTLTNSSFISVRNKSTLTIFNKNGESVIIGNYNQIAFLNDTLLKVEVNKKQGLMNIKGEFLLRPVFDVIDQQEQMIFLLDKNKIGCFDLKRNVIFMPKYESRLEKIGEYYAAKLDGKYGLFDHEEQPILNFSYDEIYLWNDTSFRVKNENLYDFINTEEESLLSEIELMSKLTATEEQEVWKFVKDGKYGLMSTKNGILLAPEFTDIFNIGTQKNPLFFADQHLNKAGFHVVSYVDEMGSLVFSKAYSIDEFDKILCED